MGSTMQETRSGEKIPTVSNKINTGRPGTAPGLLWVVPGTPLTLQGTQEAGQGQGGSLRTSSCSPTSGGAGGDMAASVAGPSAWRRFGDSNLVASVLPHWLSQAPKASLRFRVIHFASWSIRLLSERR